MNLESIFQGPITPQKWKMLGDYLKSTKINPGHGVRIQDSYTLGKTISAVPVRQPRQTQSPPFSVLTFRKVPDSSPAEYVVTLQEGIVLERHIISTDDGVQEFECKIGANFMSSRPYPELTISDGDTVWCNYTTDAEGFVQGDPVVVASSSTNNTTHHIPPSGANGGSGVTGAYWIKLFEFNVVSGKPTFTYFQQSDIEHTRLWVGRNIGSARYIHKEIDPTTGTYDFRTLEQVEPSGRTFGKVIVPFVNGDEFDDANDSIKFSAICERATSPQINVNDDGAGAVTIEGNNKDGSLTWTDCSTPTPTVTTLIEWQDGLVTSEGVKNFTAGCGDELPSGSYGEILYHNGTNWVTLANPGDPSPNEAWRLFHDGTSPYWDPVV